METNILYYGDNLEILRKYITDTSIDLIYLDPPFNSKKNYNILFKENDKQWSPAQIKAFEDTWRWDTNTEATYHDIVTRAPMKLAKLLSAMHDGIGANDVTAYLVMMAARLIELHRVLKPTGSLYLHCDPTASHYLKLLLDQIFGATNFRNEIVWHYRRWTGESKRFQRMHEIAFFYTKGDKYTFNQLMIPYTEGSVERKMQGILHRFKRGETPFLVSNKKLQSEGVPMNDVFLIPFIAPSAKERLSYPTQKPLALLERIIQASSNEGDVVLDPFCGCGTALVAAHKLNRKWIGIDITHLAITVMKRRLQDHFPGIQFKVIGEPVDLPSAKELARQNRYQFQWWSLSLIGARPLGKKKKGADKGIDGVIPLIDTTDKELKRIVISVKSGKVGVNSVRELRGVIEASKDPIGILVLLETPTEPMITEAARAGFYDSPIWQKKFPKLQILTIEDIFQGKKPNIPPTLPPPKASPINTEGNQPNLI